MNRVLAHCGARFPILQAPMGWILKVDAMLRLVCESDVRFVTTSAGSPTKFIEPPKAAASRTRKR